MSVLCTFYIFDAISCNLSNHFSIHPNSRKSLSVPSQNLSARIAPKINAITTCPLALLTSAFVITSSSHRRPFIRKILLYVFSCNGVQREHNKKLNNGLPILHKVPPKRDYGRYFCIMAEKGGTSHGGLTEKLSLFFHAKKQEVNAYGR